MSTSARSRRAPRAAKPRPARLASPALPLDLTDEELERCAQEWKGSQEHLGRLGALAESIWALDWADRLLAEIRRLRKKRA